MNQRQLKTWTLFNLIIVIFFIVSCGSEDSESVPEFPPEEDDNLPPPDDGGGESDGNKFSVRVVNEGNFPFVMRGRENFDEDCSVAIGDDEPQINCIVEVQELDLYFNGIEFEYNIPPQTCEYFTMTPYWYYNREVGFGPQNLSLNIELTEGGAIDDSSCIIDGEPYPSCDHPEVTVDLENEAFYCVYDGTFEDQPNCCFGRKVQTVTTTDFEGEVTVQRTFSDWGGDFTQCIAGPGRFAWEDFSKDGRPFSQISRANNGLNGTYSTHRPIDLKLQGNYSVANYFNSSDHFHDGFFSSQESSLPYAIDPIDDRGGTELRATLLHTASPAYTFICYDNAREVKKSINIFVRDWNTQEEFEIFVETEGEEGDPDIVGVQGIDCRVETPFLNPCADYGGWSDILLRVGGSYDTAPGNIVERINFFPMEDI